MTTPYLLRGVDLAGFAVAFVARLRGAGVVVSADGPAAFVAALGRMWPRTRAQLYWISRLTLVNRVEDLAGFDAVFQAVFADAVLGLDPPGLKQSLGTGTEAAPAVPGRDRAVADAALPWTTRPASVTAAPEPHTSDTGIPDALPSRLVARFDEPFESFDAADLRLLTRWLEQTVTQWPRRRTLHAEPHRGGKHVDLRCTIKASRTTGWEMMRVAHTRRRSHVRRVVLICDVSRSMQPYVAVYLHLMRALLLRRDGIRAEAFAFSTSLTRLTPALTHRSADVALQRANAKVVDRYGGTQLAGCLTELLSEPHGNALRGAVVIVASDGWDSTPPEDLERALARVRRRAHLLVWLNPRVAAPGFQPLAGAMAAALPYCDLLLPAHSLAGVRDLFDALRTPGR